MDEVKKLVIIVIVLAIVLFGSSFIINKQSEKKLKEGVANSAVVNNSVVVNETNNTTNNESNLMEENIKESEISDNAVIDVNANNFETEVINSDKKVLIDFYADWCGPCKRLSPIVDKVAKENTDVKFVRIDVDNNKELANRYNVSSIPTLVVIENGKEINRSVGLIPEDSILTLIGK